MRNFIIGVALILISIVGGKAQVLTPYFESKDAFKSFPVLQQIDVEKMSTKTMPLIDYKKLLEEDREMEKAIDVPYRFEHGFDVGNCRIILTGFNAIIRWNA